MVERKEYLEQLKLWKHDNVIKVITGIRRCGKSTLLKLFAEHLKNEGVGEEQIISINFEELENKDLLDYNKLYDYLCSKLVKDKYTYILLDEIQTVPDFQKAVDSLYVKENVDVYITGSNANLLSGELATLLSGRYVEISMLPLSFKEYFEINKDKSQEDSFLDFVKYGGMPYIATMKERDKKALGYLEGIYNTIVLKDIEERQKRRDGNVKNIDIGLLKTISKYLADVVGNPISIKGIANYLTSNNRKISVHTVSDYVEMLMESFIFYSVDRYDLQGKEILKTMQKYYIVDIGLRKNLVQKTSEDFGFTIENIVFLELIRRGYKVSIGKLGTKEIDFVAKKGEDVEYFQVSASLLDKNTFDRELAPLNSLKDNYPKTILTYDKATVGNYNGIKVKNLVAWLLGEE